MKKTLLIITVFPLFFWSCKEECLPPENAKPKVKVVFHTTVNGAEVASGVSFDRPGGESFQVDLMKN